MIDTENLRKTIVKGLKDYLGCEVLRGNQNIEMPDFPYIVYNITTLASDNKGTFGEYEDKKARKPRVQTWSITAYSDNYTKAVELINKVKDWLDYAGNAYLNENKVIVQSVGSISDRSNFLTTDYMYSFGLDCFFYIEDVVDMPDIGYIENVELKEI